MFRTCIRAVAVIGTAMVLAGCESSAERSSIFRMFNLEEGKSVATDAKQRVVINVPAKGAEGFNEPSRIVCAEPSPDVAQALSESISAALKVEVAGKGGGSAGFGRSTAESVAQLGERLGTIQLLRDGLYRACEAYANGAITRTTYAMIVSRYDNTMVTLLMGELAAGAFGRSGALISTAALGAAQAGGGAASETAIKDFQEKQKALDDAEETVSEKKGELEVLEKAEPKVTKSINDKKAEVKAAEEIRDKAKDKRDLALKVLAGSVGVTTSARGLGGQAMGAIKDAATKAAAGGKIIEAIHKNFLDDDARDFTPLVKACVTTLDRSKSQIQIPWEDSKKLGELAVEVHKAKEKVIRLKKKKKDTAAAEAELNTAKKKYLDKQTEVTNKLSTSRLTHLGLVCQTQIMPQIAAIISAAPDLAEARLARDKAVAEKSKVDLCVTTALKKTGKKPEEIVESLKECFEKT